MAPAKARVTSVSSSGSWSSSKGVSPMAAPNPSIRAHMVQISKNGMTTGSHLGGSVESQNARLEARIGRQHNQKLRLTGAALANEVYRTGWGEECRDDSDDYSLDEKEYDFDLGFMFQPSLELESVVETQERLESKIRDYNQAHQAMAIAALRWHQLMEDVQDDPQIRKMFLDLQMIRKLSGLDHE